MFWEKFFTNLPYLSIGFANFKNRRILVYFAAEYYSLKSKGMNPVLVDHPFEKYNMIQTPKDNEHFILIAPSFLGFFTHDFEKKVIDKWVECIKALSDHYENKIILKLHPRGQKSTMEAMSKKLFNIPSVKIVDRNTEVWPLICKSKLVVTETSSIAWQALILGAKKLFLVNIDKHLPHYMDDYVKKIKDHTNLIILVFLKYWQKPMIVLRLASFMKFLNS